MTAKSHNKDQAINLIQENGKIVVLNPDGTGKAKRIQITNDIKEDCERWIFGVHEFICIGEECLNVNDSVFGGMNEFNK